MQFPYLISQLNVWETQKDVEKVLLQEPNGLGKGRFDHPSNTIAIPQDVGTLW